MGAQFFLKNVHPEMREAASSLFGRPENLQYRANVFGELMRILMSPSRDVEQAVNWALRGGRDPDIALHMRMMMNRYHNFTIEYKYIILPVKIYVLIQEFIVKPFA